MFKLVVLPFLFAAVVAKPAGFGVPGISTTVVENGPLLSSYAGLGFAGYPAVAGVRSVVSHGPALVGGAAVVSAPAAVEYRAAAPVAVAAPAVEYRAAAPVAVAAPAVEYRAAAPVALAAPAVAVAAPITKTVHYETKPVVTGYSTQVIKSGPSGLLTDPAIVRQEKVIAPARQITRVTPQITQVQPEVNIQRVAYDVPVAQPVAVPTPVVNQIEYTAPAVEVVKSAPAIVSAPAAVEVRAGPAVVGAPVGLGLGVNAYGLGAYGHGVYGHGVYGVGAYGIGAPGLIKSSAVLNSVGSVYHV